MKLKEVYVIRNNINDKGYIGQTQQGYEKRFRTHKTCATGSYEKARNACPKFYGAMRKYGVDNFYVELLEDNILPENIDEREAYYIAKYDAVDNGYNVLIYSTNRVGYKVSEKQIKETKERWADPEYKKTQIASRRAARKSKDTRKIRNLTTGKTYGNRYILSDKLSIHESKIHKVCQNMVNTLNGNNYVYIDIIKKTKKLERLKNIVNRSRQFYLDKTEKRREVKLLTTILKRTESFYDNSEFLEDYKNGKYDDID